MKTTFVCLFIFLFLFSNKNENKSAFTLKDESGDIQVKVGLNAAAQPYYQVYFKEKMVLDTSYLGLLTERADFSKNMKLMKVGNPRKISDHYQLLHGKQREISYRALQYVLKFKNENDLPFECHFNLSKNGVAFRYYFPQGGDSIRILEERSSFGFSEATTAWMQPMSKAKSGWKETNPSYEEYYQINVPVSTKSPIGEGYVYPALFHSNGTWVLVSETNVHRNYCGTRLKYDDQLGQMRVTMPQTAEIFPGGALLPIGPSPFTTPWRTMAIGNLNNIVENTLGTDLAAPAIKMTTDYIQPGLASWSWILLKDDFINYETSRKFIDYASAMNWRYTLIDVNWDTKIGYDRMQELVDYAKSKNVGVILWYNSSGDWNSTTYSPKSKLINPDERRKEFSRLKKMGVAGVKVDFFGGDGQSMMAYYHDILIDAADNELMVNFHGATLPRGWQRTYPNLVTVEAIKGEEFITFDQKNADLEPSHCTVIPFTRNVYDPMDFTPMVLDSIPNIHRRTTAAFELALPIVFTSGIQHIAEKPEGMAKMPAYVIEFLKDIPTQWEEVRLLAGFPGKDIAIARRHGDHWFIAGLNGEAITKTVQLDLSFVKNKRGILFSEGKNASVPIEKKEVGAGNLEINMPPNGGFVMKF